MTEQKPSVGRIVHYVSYGTPGGEYTSKCRAAMVTEVGAWMDVEAAAVPGEDPVKVRRMLQYWHPEACALEVSNPTGKLFNTCAHDEHAKAGGTWHWPERV